MEKLLAILEDMKPGVDFKKEKKLIEDGIPSISLKSLRLSMMNLMLKFQLWKCSQRFSMM